MNSPFIDVESVTTGKSVSYVYVDGFKAPAGVVERNGRWIVVIDRECLNKIEDEAARLVVEKGLRLHEAAHILYTDSALWTEESSKNKREGNKNVYTGLLNICEDVRCEFLIEKGFPALSKYLSTMLSWILQIRVQGVPLNEAITKAIESWEKFGIKVDPRLLQTLEATLQAVRFGDVDKDVLTSDVIEDLNFIVPRIFLSRRGSDTRASIQAAKEIYHYLDKRYGIPPQLEISVEVFIDEGSCSDSDPDEEGKGKGGSEKEERTQVLPWKTRDGVERDKTQAYDEAVKVLDEEARKGASGRLGAHEEPRLAAPTINDIEFYLNTVENYEGTIRRLESILRALAGKRWFVPATEGDLNTKPENLQNAYVDSFKGLESEGKYYQILKPELPDIDLCLICDRSGSTYSSEVLFAESSVCLIESARRVKKARIAALGVGNGIKILKDFREPLEAGRFAPTSGGGTPLGAAIEESAKLQWRAGRVVRVAMVLTDGWPDSWERVDVGLEKLRAKSVAVIATCVGIEPDEEYRSRFEEVYQINDPSNLILTMFNAFYKAALQKSILCKPELALPT